METSGATAAAQPSSGCRCFGVCCSDFLADSIFSVSVAAVFQWLQGGAVVKVQFRGGWEETGAAVLSDSALGLIEVEQILISLHFLTQPPRPLTQCSACSTPVSMLSQAISSRQNMPLDGGLRLCQLARQDQIALTVVLGVGRGVRC